MVVGKVVMDYGTVLCLYLIFGLIICLKNSGFRTIIDQRFVYIKNMSFVFNIDNRLRLQRRVFEIRRERAVKEIRKSIAWSIRRK